MNFKDFANSVPKIKNLPLPGQQAHFQMAPEMRVRELEHLRNIPENAKEAGVMALFYPGADHLTHLLFILRRSYPGVHSDQIGFPGGRLEASDRDLLHTALRETEEEVGVPSAMVETIRSLSPLYIPPSNFAVSPFMGISRETPSFIPQESEVAALIEIPLEAILDSRNLTTESLNTSYAKNIEVPAFLFREHLVWGATAMMLNEIRTLLKEIF
ncbi:NUDIX hydrolase [Robiginitalea sp. IMCC44478]|uniref:NUDIX hydrolase n=1 Tax=Robiginitalea sp. IMCC44478 TaxID=3459122 RepID=UPI0040436E9A